MISSCFLEYSYQSIINDIITIIRPPDKIAYSKIIFLISYAKHAERGGSLDKALDWRSKGCGFETHRRGSHYVVSLSKRVHVVFY